MKKEEMSKAAKDAQTMLENPRDTKVKITINLDGDLLDEIKKLAHQDGLKYQTWLNSFLRKNIFEKDSLEERVSAIEEVIGGKSALNEIRSLFKSNNFGDLLDSIEEGKLNRSTNKKQA